MNRRSLLADSASALVLAPVSTWSSGARAIAAEGRTLKIAKRTIEINGKAASVYGLVGPDGKQGLTFNAGEMFDITLDNGLAEKTMVHWHGLTPPNEFDGVPDLPLPLLEAGEQRAYRFPVGEGGTHWMHAHTLQEQNLLAAPLIVRSAADRVITVEKGGHIRLRIINGATATGFTIDLGALQGVLVAVDGQEIVPVQGSRFPLAMGQRADIRLELPKDGGAFPVLALREGAREQTGVILATAGAEVKRIAGTADAAGPLLDLVVERRLRAARPLEQRKAYRPYMVHLHGHHFQVTAINGEPFKGAVRDIVLVPPMQTVTLAVDARNPAKAWTFHCHHLYHMASGMMSTFDYEG